MTTKVKIGHLHIHCMQFERVKMLFVHRWMRLCWVFHSVNDTISLTDMPMVRHRKLTHDCLDYSHFCSVLVLWWQRWMVLWGPVCLWVMFAHLCFALFLQSPSSAEAKSQWSGRSYHEWRAKPLAIHAGTKDRGGNQDLQPLFIPSPASWMEGIRESGVFGTPAAFTWSFSYHQQSE